MGKKFFKSVTKIGSLSMFAFLLCGLVSQAYAATGDEAVFVANNIWMMVSTFLVFIMHLGFATLEAGLTRSKNTCNILFKNTSIIAIGLLTYAFAGFNLMYPGDFNGFLGFAGFAWPFVIAAFFHGLYGAVINLWPKCRLTALASIILNLTVFIYWLSQTFIN